MRLLLGMILGALLLVGVVFVADNWTTENGAAEHRGMVNWDVVGENLRVVRQHAHSMWSKLSHKMAS